MVGRTSSVNSTGLTLINALTVMYKYECNSIIRLVSTCVLEMVSKMDRLAPMNGHVCRLIRNHAIIVVEHNTLFALLPN
jgi:hypothetical protein